MIEEALPIDIGEVSALRRRAQEQPLSLSDLRAMVSGELAPPGEDEYYVARFGDYRVVYTIEHQPHGWSRHISVSRKDGEGYVSPTDWAFGHLIEVFGFQKDGTSPKSTAFWQEKGDLRSDGTPVIGAYNLIQKLRPDDEDMPEGWNNNTEDKVIH